MAEIHLRHRKGKKAGKGCVQGFFFCRLNRKICNNSSRNCKVQLGSLSTENRKRGMAPTVTFTVFVRMDFMRKV